MPSSPTYSLRDVLYRLFLTGLTGLPLFGIYVLINRRESVEHAPVTMPDWVPFWPSMALPYLLMMLTPIPLQLAIRDRGRLYRSFLAVIISFCLIAFVWVVFPTKLIRPDFSEGWNTAIYQWMASVDEPVNILPAGHMIWPMIGVFFLGIEKRSWLWWMIPLLFFGMMTVVTTWQHRPIDVYLGAALPLAVAWLCERLFREKIS